MAAMLRQPAAQVAIAATLVLVAGCSRPRGLFVEENARAHVEMLAGTIGSRPAGTAANAQARSYIVDQLKLYGFDVRVQETDARRVDLGRTARVANIIATLPGQRNEAVGLLSHYDARADTPGAADDAFGVAVSLEAARSLASRGSRNWTLFVLITDAEEAGLMGAAALMNDREITDRLKAYLNVEAVGSGSPVVLFETGPGNAWLTNAWARYAPHPRGGSYTLEIYRRLPNDTDFSIVKRHEIPGLNFAAVGDSHSYHTARDTPDRLSRRAIRESGENVVSIVTGLDTVDITQRSAGDATYFDIAGRSAISYGPGTAWVVAAAALLFGIVGFVKVTAFSLATAGVLRWILMLVWAAIALTASAAAMAGATWALRASREVYHPWYAHPERLLVLLVIVGAAVTWATTRIGVWLPPRAHAPRHPALTWSLALPLWIALAAGALWLAPAAAHLLTVPLLVAGAGLTLVSARSALLLRIVSALVLIVVVILWLRETIDLALFIVAMFGRQPIVTPFFVYAAILTLAGMMIAPPLIATIARSVPLARPTLLTAVLLAVVATTAAFAWMAPAYTREHSLRRFARAIQDGDTVIWDVGSTEPGLDLDSSAPGQWTLDGNAPTTSVPMGRLQMPFVFRTRGPALGPPPADLSPLTVTPVEGGVELSATVVPRAQGVTVTFVAPRGVRPARSNLPGALRLGHWAAAFAAPPAEGVTWRAAFAAADAATLEQTRIIVTTPGIPGGEGWQQLPAWLPQERTVWTATAVWIVAPPPQSLIPNR